MTCPALGYPTLEDAMDRAEQNAMVVLDYPCKTCQGWHLRDAHDEEEADRTAASYRAHLARCFPELAKQRGWIGGQR